MRRWAIPWLAIVGTSCGPNLRAASSGEIGCPEAEIEIGDDSVGFGSRTWTAECRGRIYYCSAHAVGEGAVQYRCTEEAEQADSASSGSTSDEAVARSAAPEPAEPVSAPPTEAVGFGLATSALVSEQRCTEAGHTWSPSKEAFICSGTPLDVGAESKARLAFCGDKLCDLTVFVSFDGEDEQADSKLTKILRALRDKYGNPKKSERGGTAYCRSEGLVRCTSSGGAFLEQAWEWKSGEKIFMSLKGRGGKATLAVRYLTPHANQGGGSAF